MLQSNYNKTIGGYVPFGIKPSNLSKSIKAEASFRFYFYLNDLVNFIKKKASFDEQMLSNDQVFFGFRTIQIANDRDKQDACVSSNDVWKYPTRLGYAV